jgi:hypothetical protein
MSTIDEAIVALADRKMFRSADIGFAHAAAARVRLGIDIGSGTRARAYRLLSSYRAELIAVGHDYDKMPAPSGTAAGTTSPLPAVAPAKNIGRSTVWCADGSLWLKSPWEARETVKTRILAASWNKSRGCYKLPATPLAALTVAEVLGGYGIDADEAATDLVRAGQKVRQAQGKRSATDLPPVPGSKTDAWTHQRQAFWFARELPGVILDMEMGTGKSKVVADLINDSDAQATLIVCPERVVGVWPKQFAIHAGKDFHIIDPRKQNRRDEWNLLPIAQRVDLYEHALHECRCGLPHVLLTNYAAAAHEPFKSWSLRQHFDYIAYDECHRIRSAQGVWSKWARDMRSRTDRAIGGTGTMQAQTPLDVFGQARAIEPGVFGATFTGFKTRYGRFGGWENRTFEGMIPETEDEFTQKLASFTYHAGEDVLDLPELMPDVTVPGHLPPKTRKPYGELEDEMYAEVATLLEGGVEEFNEVTAPNVLVKLLRLQQLTGGMLQLDGPMPGVKGDLIQLDTAKADLLHDELEDLGQREPVVVFCKFIADLDNIAAVADKLGRPYAELSGRRSDALTADATLNPDVAVAGVQIQAGGTGVDFTRAAYGIYYSVGYSLGDYLQSRKRLHRPGQTRAVRFRHLVMEGTIDEVVYEALAARKSVTDRIAAKVKALQKVKVRA